MVTKFIGSATELKYCKKIGLIYSQVLLLESDIEKYTPGYSGFTTISILDRIGDDPGYFYYQVPSDGVIFNTIIMYTLDMTPIGFTSLGENIETDLYKIEGIKINLNFTLNYNNQAYIELDLYNNFYGYQAHIYNLPNVHKNLFDRLVDYAMSYREISKLDTSKSEFTNNLQKGLEGKIFRYSGNFYRGTNKITSKTYQIPRSRFFSIKTDQYGLSSRTELMKLNDSLWLVSWDRDRIEFTELETNTFVSIDHRSPEFSEFYGWKIINFGVNMFVVLYNGYYVFFDFYELLNRRLVEINRVKVDNEIKFVRDPIKKSLLIYRYSTDKGVEPLSLELKDIIDRLGVNNKLQFYESLVLATQGTILYTSQSVNKITTFAPGSLRIQSNIPLELTSLLSKDSDDIKFNVYRDQVSESGRVKQSGYPDDAPDDVIRYVTYGDTIEILAKSPIEYLFTYDVIDMISDKAILIHRKSGGTKVWILLEIVNNVDSIDSFNYKYVAYNLGSQGNWRKLDTISKNRVNPLDNKMDILMSPVDGTLWRLDCNSWSNPDSMVNMRIL